MLGFWLALYGVWCMVYYSYLTDAVMVFNKSSILRVGMKAVVLCY